MRTATDTDITRGCCDGVDHLFEVGVEYQDGTECILCSTNDEDHADDFKRYLLAGALDASVKGVWMKVDGEHE